MVRKKTHEEFVQEVYELVGDEYEVIGEYINAQTKIEIKHTVCKEKYDVKPPNFLSGRRCPYCSGKRQGESNTLSYQSPKICEEWDYEKNDKEPSKYKYKSTESVWWKCKTCNNGWKAQIYSRTVQNTGCPFCAPFNGKVKKGFNDLWTTNPNLASMLANPEDGFCYKDNSGKRVDWKCGICGYIIKDKIIANIARTGVDCPKCSDGFSIGEKTILNMLEKLNIEFLFQKSFTWSDRKIYDFYLPSSQTIIEVHGIQHYKETGFHKLGKSLNQEIKNDKFKREVAFVNGIKRYIELNFSTPTLQNIAKEILNCEFFSKIDMQIIKESFKRAKGSLLLEVCRMFNSGMLIKDISNNSKLHSSTIWRYLKAGHEAGLIDYNSEKSSLRFVGVGAERCKKSIVRIDKDDYKRLDCFESIREAQDVYGVSLHRALKDLSKTAYGYRWMYKEDYDAMIAEHGKVI